MKTKKIPLAKKYLVPVVATDVVIFTMKENKLQVLLIQMKKHPFEKCWALPGGLLKADESVDAAARRCLVTKTGVDNGYLEQLATFGKVNRDPFGRVISVAYFALIPSDVHDLKTTDEYGAVEWKPVLQLPKLAYDHKEIIAYALKRLQAKLRYSNIAYSLLPDEFTLTELQKIYEIILGKNVDKRNFRKKIDSLKILKKANKKRVGERSRPALLYTFVDRSFQEMEIV